MTNVAERLTLEEKLNLIKSRARLMGFRRHDLEDAVQEVVFTVLEFEYEVEKSNGATETTALTAVIDRKLVSLVRTNRCYARLIERATDRLAVECKGFEDGPFREEHAGEELIASAEVAAALEGLDTVAVQVAQLLMQGHAPNAIADQLGKDVASKLFRQRVGLLCQHRVHLSVSVKRDVWELSTFRL